MLLHTTALSLLLVLVLVLHSTFPSEEAKITLLPSDPTLPKHHRDTLEQMIVDANEAYGLLPPAGFSYLAIFSHDTHVNDVAPPIGFVEYKATSLDENPQLFYALKSTSGRKKAQPQASAIARKVAGAMSKAMNEFDAALQGGKPAGAEEMWKLLAGEHHQDLPHSFYLLRNVHLIVSSNATGAGAPETSRNDAEKKNESLEALAELERQVGHAIYEYMHGDVAHPPTAIVALMQGYGKMFSPTCSNVYEGLKKGAGDAGMTYVEPRSRTSNSNSTPHTIVAIFYLSLFKPQKVETMPGVSQDVAGNVERK